MELMQFLSDFYIFWAIQIIIFTFFMFGFCKDLSTRKKRRVVSIKRVEKTLSLVRRVTTFFIAVIVVTIISFSEVVKGYKIIIFLSNILMIIYMGLLSPFYRNKIIHINSKIDKIEE
jgi:hypothetical protein